MKRYYLTIPLILCIGTGYLWAQKKTVHKKGIVHKTAAPAGSMAVSIANGKKVFVQYCLSCHQADGGGVQNMNPPLIKTTYVLGDKTKLISILQNGFHDKVEIDGDTYSNVMPAFDYLKDQEVADVLTYVRNSFGNKASMVTVKEVTAIRPTVKK